MLAWNNIVPPRESHDVLHLPSRRGGGPGPEMREETFTRTDAMCPIYTQQVIGNGGAYGIHNQSGYRGSYNGGPVVETRPYFDPTNGQPFNGSVNPSYYTPRDKRGSIQTLSTISEVRYSLSSPSKSLVDATGRRATCCGGESVGDQVVTLPWINNGNHHHSQPPPSATESVKSHWSDDSDDDKKGFAGFNIIVKSTRDSLTRKSSKGSKTSSNKGDKTLD
jgi:hypothetical protein